MADKIKILVIAGVPPPLHGTTLAVQQLLASSLQQSHELYHIDTRFESTIRNLGRITPGKLARFIFYVPHIILTLRRLKPALVILTPAFGRPAFFKDSFFIHLVSCFSKARIILWCHGNGLAELYEAGPVWIKRYITATLHRADAFVPVIKSMASGNRDFFRRPGQMVFPIYNGIAAGNAPGPGLEPSPWIGVVYLSNLLIEKGWLLLFQAACAICRDLTHVRFDFYGEPDEESARRIHLFESNNPFPDRIRYHGAVYGEEKNRIIQAMDIFCFPSFYRYETFGIVNLEAMRAGKPIVTTRHAGLPEIVDHGLGGFIIEPRHLDQLILKLKELIGDKELRESMGAYNRKKFSATFTLDRHVQRWQDLFRQLLDEPRRTNRRGRADVRH